jgi:integrase
MAKILLTSSIVASTVCPTNQKKLDLFDTQTKGFLLEVRSSGGKTFYLRYQDSRGKTRQLKLADSSDVSLSQAHTLAEKARNKIAMGGDPSVERVNAKLVPTLVNFSADRYMPFANGYKRSWSTDDSILRNHLLPVLGKKRLDEITKHDVIAFHDGMRTDKYAPGTCNRCLILLRYMMNLAIRWEIPGITKNPTKDVPLFDDPNKKDRYLTAEETQTLYQFVLKSDNEMLQYIIPMLILTGARKSEVINAQWSEFDLNHKQWRISVTKAGKPRYVPLSENVLKMLASMPRDDNPWVFANPKTHKPYVSIFDSWNTARKRAGLSDVRIHDLRHSFASFLVNAGRSLYEVQRILGHSQIRTTQRYAHLSQDTLINAANVVPFSMATPVVTVLATLNQQTPEHTPPMLRMTPQG